MKMKKLKIKNINKIDKKKLNNINIIYNDNIEIKFVYNDFILRQENKLLKILYDNKKEEFDDEIFCLNINKIYNENNKNIIYIFIENIKNIYMKKKIDNDYIIKNDYYNENEKYIYKERYMIKNEDYINKYIYKNKYDENDIIKDILFVIEYEILFNILYKYKNDYDLYDLIEIIINNDLYMK